MRVLKHNSLNPVRNSDSRNKAKANQDINTFLDASEERINHFYNYLNLIDNQRGNK